MMMVVGSAGSQGYGSARSAKTAISINNTMHGSWDCVHVEAVHNILKPTLQARVVSAL